MAVSYKLIAGHPGYRVGDDGSVWSCWRPGRVPVITSRWHRLKPGRAGKYRHLQVQLGRNNSARVGALVLSSFIGPCPDGHECRHLDGDASNNRLDNLKWGTSAENTDDQRRHARLVGGERHGMAKLTNTQIDALRSLAGTLTQREIARRFGISQGHVSDILSDRRRTVESHSCIGLKNAPRRYAATRTGLYARGAANPLSKLTADIVLKIRRRAADGESQRSIAKHFGVTQACVSAVVTRKTWKEI